MERKLQRQWPWPGGKTHYRARLGRWRVIVGFCEAAIPDATISGCRVKEFHLATLGSGGTEESGLIHWTVRTPRARRCCLSGVVGTAQGDEGSVGRLY